MTSQGEGRANDNSSSNGNWKDFFIRCVFREFGYLEQFGFIRRGIEPESVKYQHGRCEVVISFNPSTNEISCVVDFDGPTDALKDFFALEEIEDYYKIPLIRSEHYIATSAKRIEGIIHTLADRITSCIKAGMLEDPKIRSELNLIRGRLERSLVLDSNLRRIRVELDCAWNRKDYEEVERILSPIEAHLSDAEKMKLRYSRRKRNEV